MRKVMADDLLRPAFFVRGNPNFESGPPGDAMEYLRRVRHEAQQLPKVVISKIDHKKIKKQVVPVIDYFMNRSVYMRLLPPAASCPPEYLPTCQWEDTAAYEFAGLRQALARYSKKRNKAQLLKARKKKMQQQLTKEWRFDGKNGGQTDEDGDDDDDTVNQLPSSHDESSWADFCWTSDDNGRDDNDGGNDDGDDDKHHKKEENGDQKLRKGGGVSETLRMLRQKRTSARQRRQQRRPLLSYISRMDHVAICTAIRALVAELKKRQQKQQLEKEGGGTRKQQQQQQHAEDPSADNKAKDEKMNVAGLSGNSGAWIYSLLAHLEKPIDSEMASCLRSLYRICAEIRAEWRYQAKRCVVCWVLLFLMIIPLLYSSIQHCFSTRKGNDDDKGSDSPKIRMIARTTVLLTIISRIFNQKVAS